MSSVILDTIKSTGRSQCAVARSLGISAPAFSQILNHGVWPRRNTAAVRSAFAAFLTGQGLTSAQVDEAFNALSPAPTLQPEGLTMIRKQVLTQDARRKYGIPRNIFDEVTDMADFCQTAETRYVIESLYHTAKDGGMVALVGQSGSGKSTIRRALLERINAADSRIIAIQPYVLAMADDKREKATLRASHVCEAILSTVAPSVPQKSSPEARFRQMHAVLSDSAEAGYRHVVIIEEAHDMPYKLIKEFKRFHELERGMTRLLSFIFIGQPELKNKLAENNSAVREVVQRTELIELHPLDDLEGYVRHRCERAGAKFDNIFAADAMADLALLLRGPSPKGGGAGMSLLYPLLVGNTLTKAINTAAANHSKLVDGATIHAASSAA